MQTDLQISVEKIRSNSLEVEQKIERAKPTLIEALTTLIGRQEVCKMQEKRNLLARKYRNEMSHRNHSKWNKHLP
jgi:prophage DNA circulation protein